MHRSSMFKLVGLVAVAAFIGGCDATSAGPPTTSSTAEVVPPLDPAMGLPANAVEDAVGMLHGIADELLKASGVPGMAVAVVHGGKTLYASGFGVKDVCNGDAPGNRVDPDPVFQLASLSKSLSSTVVAHQVGAAAVSWNTPVVEKLPWFALADPTVTRMVTVGDMFAHRSGLPDQAGDLLEDLGYDRAHVLEHLRQLPLGEFRTSYEYTNFGLTAGAEAVAVGAGTSWESLCQEVLYGPLGMTI